MNIDTFTKIVKQVGDDHVKLQNLSASIFDARSARGCTKVSFNTSAITPTDVALDIGKVGVVVWMDRKRLQHAEDHVLTPKLWDRPNLKRPFTESQKRWLAQFEIDTGFEPYLLDSYEAGEIETFEELATKELQWFRDHVQETTENLDHKLGEL